MYDVEAARRRSRTRAAIPDAAVACGGPGSSPTLAPNHVLSCHGRPAQWASRAVIRCRRLDMVPVECIARGYLGRPRPDSYRATGAISGCATSAGLVEADQLPEPVFTPTTKAKSDMTNS